MGAEIKGAIRRFIMQQMSHIKAAEGRPSPGPVPAVDSGTLLWEIMTVRSSINGEPKNTRRLVEGEDDLCTFLLPGLHWLLSPLLLAHQNLMCQQQTGRGDHRLFAPSKNPEKCVLSWDDFTICA